MRNVETMLRRAKRQASMNTTRQAALVDRDVDRAGAQLRGTAESKPKSRCNSLDPVIWRRKVVNVCSLWHW